MNKFVRLDKYLADIRIGTRREVKKYIKQGNVKLNNHVIKDSAYKVNINNDKVYFKGKLLSYSEYIYIMLNKPSGVVSATKDNFDKTVVDLIEKKYQLDLFPVGRLDKDSEGLLLLTNDGDLAHSLLSPKNKVAKVYYVELNGQIKDDHILQFKKGIKINDEFIALPAELEIIEAGDISKALITVFEGKFHQVKRMFLAIGLKVTYLKRTRIAQLEIDESLELGEYRHLTKSEIDLLK
ncbi:MAG TPA: rRNA pseudouridine synthase [Clostridiales bacterium]|nr:rRNA pseudouridine synthase [Clostridiales bacterium]